MESVEDYTRIRVNFNGVDYRCDECGATVHGDEGIELHRAWHAKVEAGFANRPVVLNCKHPHINKTDSGFICTTCRCIVSPLSKKASH